VIKRIASALVICLVALPPLAAAQELPTPLPAPPMVDVALPLAQTPAPPPQPPAGTGPRGTPPKGTPPAQPGPTGGVQTPPPVAQTQLQTPRKIRGRDVNVQVEITITEHQGAGPGEKRVVSMIVADAAFGRIRSTASQDVKLNIDTTPTLLENDRIALELTVEYIPVTPEGASRRPAGLLEMLTVILQNGKPMLISQAADPTIDRRITLEVRASVMK
jgi:hypothetical protein